MSILSTVTLLSLSALGSWEILRRLLPVKLPVVAGQLIVVGLAWVLLSYAPTTIITALCVLGVLLLISRLIDPEPHEPWGPPLLDLVRTTRSKHDQDKLKSVAPQRRIGRRMPPL